MQYKLIHTHFEADGIFGNLHDESGAIVAITLEHSYAVPNSNIFDSKLQPGLYQCVRGIHRLHDNVPFETFEIEGVVGHDNILFHVGNYNKDSEGCVLLGQAKALTPNKDYMITGSKYTFNKFMESLIGIDKFTLTVLDYK